MSILVEDTHGFSYSNPMDLSIFISIMIPFIGTSIGVMVLFIFKHGFTKLANAILLGFAAGVMVAASVWSLLIPSIEASTSYGQLAFLPAVVGLLLGFAFLLLIDSLLPHLHVQSHQEEGISTSRISSTMKMVFAIIIHNIPEGMAVGVTIAALMNHYSSLSFASLLALTIGIAIQNIPEGAIVSLPLKASTGSTIKAIGYGLFSGIVEPLSALLTIRFSMVFTPFLPYLLSFAAGAMLYVVVEEMIPQSQCGDHHSNLPTIGFAIGFALMMILDVALG